MLRKDFLKASSGIILTSFLRPGYLFAAPDKYTYSVLGKLKASNWGTVLEHEHILVDFGGADIATPERYDRREAFDKALPFLLEFKKLGGETLFECTPAYLGRDPILLKELSEKSGVNIITNTGYYGARNEQHLPPHAFSETPEQLAGRWIREFRHGIDDTGIKPGFIKIGMGKAPLSEPNKKLIKAAAIAHLATGLTIASHTGLAEGALEQLQILKENNVHPSAFVWVHAQNEDDLEQQAQIARTGAWISLDGISAKSIDRHFAMVDNLRNAGLLSKVLISHDAGWYHVGEEGGGDYRPYSFIFEQFLPLLRKKNYSSKDINMLVKTNPANAFSIRIRRTNN